METTTVKIPTELAKKIEEHNKGKGIELAGMDSISSYVTYVMRQVMGKLDRQTDKDSNDEEIEKELKTLGYLE